MFHLIFGWLGALFFAICAVPQVFKTYKTKKAEDLSLWFLSFWLGGEILTLAYIAIDDFLLGAIHLPLYINYIFNIVLVLYLIYAKKRY